MPSRPTLPLLAAALLGGLLPPASGALSTEPGTLTLELFVGADPGHGAGHHLVIDAAEGPPVSALSFDMLPPALLDTLSPGVATLSARLFDPSRSESEQWSPTLHRTLFLLHDFADLPVVAEVEAYVGTDPGAGSATPLPQSETGALDAPTTAAAPTLAALLQPGLNTVFLRARDSHGRWSTPVGRTVYMERAGSAPLAITAFRHRIVSPVSAINGTGPAASTVTDGATSTTVPTAYQVQADLPHVLALAPVDADGRLGHERFIQFTPRDSFVLWQERYFNSEEIDAGTLTTPEADADGDGLPNFAEYAFGLHPREFSPPPATILHEAEMDGEGRRLVISYPRNPQARHFAWSFPATDDLAATWQPTAVEQLAVTPVSDEVELVTVRESAASTTPRHFLRVEVAPPAE